LIDALRVLPAVLIDALRVLPAVLIDALRAPPAARARRTAKWRVVPALRRCAALSD
jgi:hypothetical protein